MGTVIKVIIPQYESYGEWQIKIFPSLLPPLCHSLIKEGSFPRTTFETETLI